MSRRLGRSLRTRLALWASIAMLLLNVVVSAFVLFGIRNEVADIRAREVTSKSVRVLLMVKRNRLPQVLPDHGLDGVQVVNPRGRPVAWTRGLAGAPRLTTEIPHHDQANEVARLCDLPRFPGTCKTVVVLVAYQPEGEWLIYGVGPAVPWYVAPQVIAFQAVVTAALVVLTWFGVSRVVARTLRPVGGITKRLAEISEGGGGMRVPVPETDDEIRALAETSNRTLERLESALQRLQEAMERQRQFAADASHDLRSPITAMRAQVEDALLHPEDADWPETGAEVLASLERLQAIVTDLLTLSKLDAGAPDEREPLDLADLVTAETARPRSKRIVTTLQTGVVVNGDRLQLARLLTNLLDNAERHAESQIIVTLRRQGDEAVLEVVDDGTGIAPEHREKVFERFTRLDASRSRDAGGTGLGLPIAREIATAHLGTLTIEDSDTGARFVLRLPVQED
ncbi:probable two-component sensor kinase [[Actinomadura] parvosata subsp. kistnae]|nr:HAMP domain-containing sensor histidine kinase [Nonomuraea sp. ATCC 55076]SPL91671.1 probable two-component sensor kinase [Actinomadura parvosata subsp. kistnae]